MADPQIGQGFNNDIAYRYKPGQPQAEFYSQKTGQTFNDQKSLADYVNTNYQGANATPDNVFNVIAGGYTPRAQALDQIKTDLNSYQDNLFNTTDEANKRQSSSITDSITSEQTNYDTYLKEYNDLKAKLNAVQPSNYEQTYTDLANEQGIPKLNTDIANIDAQRNNLPYVNRAASGNAGIETESQLSADTAQKDVPLEVQQQNLIDRLKLAQDFVDNSIKFKQMDSDQARQSISDAINAVTQAISMSESHLSSLTTQQKAQDDRNQLAQQFAFDNRITQPFYDIGGTVYRTSDRMPAHNKEEYIAMGGTGDFSDVQKINPAVKPIEVNPGNTLVNPDTGETIYQAPGRNTGSGSGNGSGDGSSSTGLTSKQTTRINQIIKANPGEWGKAADQIDAEFGKGTATKADNILKTAYLIPADAQTAEQLWLSLPKDQQTLDEWNQGLLVFQQAHSYDTATATKLFKQFIPKPRS